jgi:hypothetical protein
MVGDKDDEQEGDAQVRAVPGRGREVGRQRRGRRPVLVRVRRRLPVGRGPPHARQQDSRSRALHHQGYHSTHAYAATHSITNMPTDILPPTCPPKSCHQHPR